MNTVRDSDFDTHMDMVSDTTMPAAPNGYPRSAMGMYDQEGRLAFQNALAQEKFPRNGLSRWLPTREVSGEPIVHSVDERQWLVDVFPVSGPEDHSWTAVVARDVTDRLRVIGEMERASLLLGDIMRKLPVIAGQLDSGGRVISVQGEGLTRPGLRPDELRGMVFSEKHPGAREAIERALGGGEASFTLNDAASDPPWHVDFYVVTFNGSGATFFGRDVSERRWLEQRLLSISHLEQQRIGADLHDSLGQKLTGLSCIAAVLSARLKRVDPNSAGLASLVQRLSNEAIEETRALAHGLCPVNLEEEAGLVFALTELAAQTELLHGIKCRFDQHTVLEHCDNYTSVHLYRITQEAINNAIRHGGSKRIEISITSQGNRHSLDITDDGRGFDTTVRQRTHGLKLMEFRANMIDGALSIESRTGRGTKVSCRFQTSAKVDENSKAP